MVEFLAGINLSHLLPKFKDLDIETIIGAEDEAKVLAMGVTPSKLQTMRHEAGHFNLTDTPVLVHLFEGIGSPAELASHGFQDM